MQSQLKVLWDYDNTLATTERPAMGNAHDLASEELAKRGAALQMSREQFIEHFTGYTFGKMMQELRATHNFELTDTEVERLVVVEREMQIARLPDSPDFGPTDGIMAALEELHKRHIEMAVVTSTAIDRIIVCLEAALQTPFFPHNKIFSAQSSFSVPRPKDLPDVYNLAMEKLGGEKSDFIAIEDSKSGIRSALNAEIPYRLGYVGAAADHKQQPLAEVLFDNGAIAVISHMSQFVNVYDTLSAGRIEDLQREHGKKVWLNGSSSRNS